LSEPFKGIIGGLACEETQEVALGFHCGAVAANHVRSLGFVKITV
jgi:hypothetical protein